MAKITSAVPKSCARPPRLSTLRSKPEPVATAAYIDIEQDSAAKLFLG